MTRAPRRSQDRGFALIEALGSLVIVGMISLLLLQGVGTGRRVWERIDTTAASAEAVEGAQTLLRGRIEQMYPATLYGGDEAEVDIAGGPDTLEFLAPATEAGRPSPLRRYRLELDVGGNLSLSSISDVVWARDPAITKQILLSGVQQIDIAYFGTEGQDHTRQWRTTWSQNIAAPDLVRVRVAFRRGDKRRWPDLIVHPLTTIDSACILSAATSRCRGRG
jgi:general secretion pathway protein J